MKKFLIIVLIVGGIWLLYKNNPTFNDHKDAISSRTSISDPRWKDLGYRNYFLISFTQSEAKKTMVSFGIASYINVTDEKWLSWNN